MVKVLVCGGRDFFDEACVEDVLRTAHELRPFTLLMHGGATGADRLAGAWARANNIPVKSFPALWQHLEAPGAVIKLNHFGQPYNARAGFDRNQRMLDDGKPDMVIAFPGGNGTADMCERARAAGLTPTMVTMRAAGATGGSPGR